MIRNLGVTMQKGSQLMNYNFMIYKTMNYFASQGFESLMTQISQSTTAQNVMDLFNQHKGLYNNEHIVLTARTLGRLSKTISPDILNEQEFKANYAELTQRIETILADLNEFDLLDVLFWLRRCKISKFQVNVSYETYMMLFRRIGEYVQQQVYSFRNLVNIYYDMSMLDKYWDYAPDFLLKSIKSDPSQITQFTSMQILQAVSKRADRLTNKEAILADIVIRNIQPILDDFDYDQKANLFKYISLLESHYQYPSFKIPTALYTLRNQLLEKLDKLSEQPVTNIILAYQSLPSYFPSDLLEEIIDMVIVTLQHNSENLKTYFLISFTDAVTQIQRRPLDQAKLNIIIQEMGKRLENMQEQKMRLQTAEKMVSILNRLPRDQIFIEIVFKIAKNAMQDKKWIPVGIIEYLSNQKEKISELAELIDVDSSLQLNNTLKIKLLCSLLRSNMVESELINKLKESIEQQVTVNPSGIILSQDNLNNFNNQFIKQQNTRAIQQLTQDLTEENFFKYFKCVFISIQEYQQRQLWLKYFEEKQFNKRIMSRFIEDFVMYNKVHYNQENTIFFLTMVSKHVEFVQGQRLVTMICSQNKLCYEISRNDNFLRRFVQILIQIKEQRNNEIRFGDVLQIVMRLEQYNNRSFQFKKLLKKMFELSKQSSDEKLPWDSAYITFLIKYKCLQIEQAAQYMDNIQSNDLILKMKLLGLAQQTQGGLEKYSEQLQSILVEIKERLKSDQVNKQLSAVSGLLNLHPSSFQGLEEQMLRIVVENSSKMSDRVFQSLIMAIQPKWYKQYEFRQIYQPIVKELFQIHAIKKSQFCDSIILMEHFNQMNVKNPQIFNQFLTECGNNFENMLVEQRVRILNIFANASIKQQDFFQKNLERIRDFNRYYQPNIQDISSSLFRVGLDDQANVDIYMEIINKYENLNDVDRLYIIQTACMMGAPVEFISKILDGLNDQGKFYGAPRFLQPIIDYLRLLGLNEGSLKIQKIQGEQIQKIDSPNFKNSLITNTLMQYLQSMKLKVEQDRLIDGQSIDIYIGEQKCILQLVFQQQQNLFQDSYNGRVLLKYKTLKMIKDHKVILIPIKEFNESGYNHIDKINYLLSKGIVTQVADGQYDFSQIKTKIDKYQQIVKEDEELLVEETVNDEGSIKD